MTKTTTKPIPYKFDVSGLAGEEVNITLAPLDLKLFGSLSDNVTLDLVADKDADGGLVGAYDLDGTTGELTFDVAGTLTLVGTESGSDTGSFSATVVY